MVVRSTVLLTVQLGADPSSWARRRSTTCPETWRYTIWSPAGDQAGPQLSPSSVTLTSSEPVDASRMTTSVPNWLVLVAAMYRPSGEYAGWMYPGPVTALAFLVSRL